MDWRLMIRRSAATAAVLSLGIAAGASGARAEAADSICEAALEICLAACGCDRGDIPCLLACPEYAGCLARYDACGGPPEAGDSGAAAPAEPGSGADDAPSPPPRRAPASVPDSAPAPEPDAAAAPPPRTDPVSEGAIADEATAEEAGSEEAGSQDPLTARVYFMPRGAAEPEARYFGYLLIGSGVGRDRQIAVMRGIGCRLDAAPSLDALNAIENLGVVTLPSRRAPQDVGLNPAAMILAYDGERAERWIGAIYQAAGGAIDVPNTVMFVGGSVPLAAALDRSEAPDLSAGDIVVADASALDARYLSRWTDEIIQGVRAGKISGRNDFQQLMELHSWISVLGRPLAAVMRLAPAQAAEAPTSCL